MIRAGSLATFFCRFLAAITTLPSVAEEGGSGHYFSGSMSSFVDDVVGPKNLFRIGVKALFPGPG